MQCAIREFLTGVLTASLLVVGGFYAGAVLAASPSSLFLYTDFSDGKLPSYSDWGLNKLTSVSTQNVVNGALVFHSDQPTTQEKLSFANDADELEVNFQVNNEAVTSDRLYFRMLEFSRAIPGDALTDGSFIRAEIFANFFPDNTTTSGSVGATVGKWDGTKKSLTPTYDWTALPITIEMNRKYRVRGVWRNGTIQFYFNDALVYTYTLQTQYVANPKPYTYFGFDSFTTPYAPVLAKNVFDANIFSISTSKQYQSTASKPDCLFNWAEKTYPEYFSPASGQSQTLDVYTYRQYTGNTYLAISSKDNHLWAILAGSMMDAGPAAQWYATVGCQ